MMDVDRGTLLTLTGGVKLKQRVQHPKVHERKARGNYYWFFRYESRAEARPDARPEVRSDARPDTRGDKIPLPSISDLLKEGQEIIVQIAKEPLGQKGARITSHIALPGRFLVYM